MNEVKVLPLYKQVLRLLFYPAHAISTLYI